MRRETFEQIKIIKSDSFTEFQDEVNKAMRELADKSPVFQLLSDKGLCALITYTDHIEVMDSIADEFHADGIYYLCKHCPYLDDPHDRRVKRCTCKYAKNGVTYKDVEACEVFYKSLKRGDITPLPDYAR